MSVEQQDGSRPCPFAIGAREYPQRIAVYAERGAISFGAMHRLVSAARKTLVANNVRAGDRITIEGRNSLDSVVVLFAAFRLGATVCPLNPRMPQDALAEQIQVVEPTLHVRSADSGEAIFRVPTIRIWQNAETITTADAASSGDSPEDSLDDCMWNLRAFATILFTSGSTGTAKAVVHTLANHYYSALGSEAMIPLHKSAVWLVSLPIYHVGGLAILFRCAIAGCAARLCEPRAAAALMTEPDVTHASLVQAQLKRWIDLGGAVGGSVDSVLLGGSALAPGLVAAAIRLGLPIRLSYGLTEMASQVATTVANRLDPLSGRCGVVLPYREVMVEESGRILVRGETLFAGYVKPDGLETPFSDDGWFATSDVGFFEDGELVITGRLDNLFISGGENIHPEPIERMLSRMECVKEVVVVPVVDEEYGRRPVAIIDADGPLPTVPELKAFLSSVLPSYMAPFRVLPWPEGSERDEISKLDRLSMREYAEKRVLGENG